MRLLKGSAVVVSICAVVALAGCSGGGAPSGLDPIPDGYGRISINVNWPTADSQSRRITTACQSLRLSVTGPGIGTPITATVNAPTTSANLTVPVGSDRVVDSEGYDAASAGGTQIQKAYQTTTLPEVGAGQTYNVTLYMGDMADPGDDDYTGATTADTDGTLSPWYVIDGVAGDYYDSFEFTAVAGEGYTFATQDVAGTGSGYTFRIYDTNGTTTLKTKTISGVQDGVAVWTAPANGQYFFSVDYGFDARMQYRGTVTTGGTGSVDIIVD